MEITKTDFGKLVDGAKNFCIPVYQRHYSWTNGNCKTIFSDIEKIASRKKESGKFSSHFIGSIVSTSYQANPECPQYTIIDGQQRITSLMLLIKALYDSSDDEILKKRMFKKFLINEDYDEQYKYKLKPIRNDLIIFNKIINSQFEELSDLEKKSLVYKNYHYFLFLINNSKLSVNELYQAISYLVMGNIVLEDENPQQIFESLNSTGKSLTNSDLIRNYILMPTDYDKQVELYNQYWKKIEDCLEVENKNEIISNLDSFLICYLCMKKKSDALNYEGKRSHINNRTLYFAYKEYFEDNPDISVDDFLKDLKDYAEIFSSFITNNKQNHASNLIYQIMVYLNIRSASILLMYIYNQFRSKEISEQLYNELISDIASYCFRLKFKNSSLDSQDFSLILQRYCKRNELSDVGFRKSLTIELCQNAGDIYFPSDEEFKNDVANCQFYKTFKKSEAGRIILSIFEKFLSKENVDISDASIEHICPQDTKEWNEYLVGINDLDKINMELDKIGNLTLTKYNSELSNSVFSKKLDIYKDSNFAITRLLGEYSEWNSDCIKKRGEWFGQLATRIWKLPPDYNDAMYRDFSNRFELSDNIDSFTGSKPEMLIFDGEKRLYDSTWSGLYIQFLQYTLNKYGDSFKEVLPDNYYSDHPNSNLRAEKKITDDFYVETNFSTERCIKYIRKIAEYCNMERPISVKLKKKVNQTSNSD